MSLASSKPILLDYSAFWWTSDTFQSDLVFRTPVADLYRRFRSNHCCPYCDTEAILIFAGFLPGPEHDCFEHRQVSLWGCPSCGWWHEEFSIIDFTFPGWERIKRRVPYLREFEVDSASIPIRALSSALLSRPELLCDMDPARLERFTASVLSDFHAVEVAVIGRSGDGGVDLVYVHCDRPFAVQVKRRQSPGATEGISLIREFLGACVLSGHRRPQIVSTAASFTRGAEEAAKEAVRRRVVDSFELISRDKFIEYFHRTSFATLYPWTPIAQSWIRDWKDIADATLTTNDAYIQ